MGDFNNPEADLDRFRFRLGFAADLPTPDEALKALKKNSSGAAPVRGDAGAPAPRAPVHAEAPERPSAQVIDMRPPLSQRPADSDIWLRSFDDVARLAGKMRDAKLRTELESYVHVVAFREGKIELRLHDDAPADLANRLTLRLKQWTGKSWIVSVTSEHEGDDTLRDRRTREVMAHPLVQKALELFPGAKVTAIREPEAPAAPAPDETEEDAPVDPDDEAVAEAIAARKETGKA